jgi:hypothetical protein
VPRVRKMLRETDRSVAYRSDLDVILSVCLVLILVNLFTVCFVPVQNTYMFYTVILLLL